MKRAFLLLSFVVLALGCAGPEQRALPASEMLKTSDFDFLVGSWEGLLDYLDYGDDQTRVELPARATYTLDGQLRFDFVFTEPSGEAMKDGGTLVVHETGKIVTGGETYQLVRKNVDADAEMHEIVFRGRGYDNNRPALITHTVTRRGDALVIQKEVIYEGTSEPLLRHEFRFERQP